MAAWATPAGAHVPPAPDPECRGSSAVHDILGVGPVRLRGGMLREVGAGSVALVDGAQACFFEPACSGEVVLDPDGAPASGDEAPLPCGPLGWI
ncbi:MAG TPA: hypothetical protein VHH36_01485, partial [Candidatus Thermoplasmatota archaeon]|nr:hypothetical protein [Candidatus Thermoplasmatota archaeon]